MAVTGKMYLNAMKIGFGSVTGKNINWISDTIKVLLVSPSYVPSMAHTVLADIGTNEVIGNGYTSGGLPITTGTKSISSTTVTNGVYLNTSTQTVTWPNSTIPNIRYAIIYDASVLDANGSPYLIGYIDFGEILSSFTSDFVIGWSADELSTANIYNVFKISMGV